MNTEPTTAEQTHPDTTSNRRRRGFVARLPKVLRDKINSMLDDGFTYNQIIEELQKSTNPPLPYPLNEDCISTWKLGGYQDYLRNQSWRERIDTRADRYLEVAANDAPQLVAGSLYAATLEISELMDELAQPKSVETDDLKLARISHALARLSQSMLKIQQYRDALAKQKDAKDAKPMKAGVTREELARITKRINL